MTTPKPKKPPRARRKFVLIEVETTLSNADLIAHAEFLDNYELGPTRDRVLAILQVHVNTAKEVSRG